MIANPSSALNLRPEAGLVLGVEGVSFAQVHDFRAMFWDGCLGPAPGLQEPWLTFVERRGRRERDCTWGQLLLVEAILM